MEIGWGTVEVGMGWGTGVQYWESGDEVRMVYGAAYWGTGEIGMVQGTGEVGMGLSTRELWGWFRVLGKSEVGMRSEVAYW